MRDIFSQLKLVKSIAAAAIAADNTPIAVDQRGFHACVYAIAVGPGGITFSPTNKIEFKLSHSDDGVNWTPVTNDDVQLENGGSVGEGGIVKALTAPHDTAAVYKVGYIGNRNFHRLLADFSGTHTDSPTPIAATAILGHPLVAPV